MTEFTSARLAELKAVAEAGNGSSDDQSIGYDDFGDLAVGKGVVLALIAALDAKTYEAQRLRAIGQGLIKQRDEARATAEDHVLDADATYVRMAEKLERANREGDEARAEVERLRERQESSDLVNAAIEWNGRALDAEDAIERVREAATEVTNQGDNHGRTHYENCWTQHLHCLAAKIIHETEADDE